MGPDEKRDLATRGRKLFFLVGSLGFKYYAWNVLSAEASNPQPTKQEIVPRLRLMGFAFDTLSPDDPPDSESGVVQFKPLWTRPPRGRRVRIGAYPDTLDIPYRAALSDAAGRSP